MSAALVIVTFLFTDIEGSTRRWEADADAMRVALATHDEVLRTAINDCGGALFKHTGDGVCAAFSSPRAAVDAATAAQRALELPVRMGIATGEAEARGDDYFGTVLNRASRVMSAGHGGQVLLDGATAELLAGIELQAMGLRRLRDIVKPIQLFQVRAPGLNTEFAPLRTADPAVGNLRLPPTGLIGREQELTELNDALKSHRLVTLTGVGGVGKTRLAMELGSRAAGLFPDGVFVIELASIGDPAAVPEAVAAVLGITQQPGFSMADSVAAALEGRDRLLVFDNCEHVLDAAADMIEAILTASTTVRILATSREGLRVPDEQLRPVSSLDVRAGGDSPAVALFVERAAAVSPGNSLDGRDAEDSVVDICRRLDGIPLAIELAASRLVSMTVTELRERLDDRFRLLVGSRRGLDRHQTLLHAVQWSYDLLDEAERALLQRCSVFAGGFDLSAASAVGGGGDEYATLDVLDSLVRKSLLVADRATARTRLSMLETIRQFAEDQLVADVAADEARTAHARYFAGRESTLLTLWDSPRQREAYEWFTTELPNLRSAFRWAADESDLDAAAAIASYSAFLGFWVNQYEPVAWAEELVEPALAIRHPRLAQLYIMASECYVAGRIDDSVQYAEAGRLAIETGQFDDVPHDFEAAALGGGYITKGQPERWLDLCRNLIERTPGSHTYARAARVFAYTFTDANDEALAAAAGLLQAAEDSDVPSVSSFALFAWGWAHRDHDPQGAYQQLQRGLDIARDSGNRQVESHVVVNLTRLAAGHGDAVDVFELLTVSIRHYYDTGYFSLMPSPLAVLTAVLDRLGHYESAATISGYAATPLTWKGYPEMNSAIVHLREVLGEEAYESLARGGARMSNASVATYALEQIDRVRAAMSSNATP